MSVDARSRQLAAAVLAAARTGRGADADVNLVALRRRVLRRGPVGGSVAAALAEASEHFEDHGELARAAVAGATVLAASTREPPGARDRLVRLAGAGAPIPLGPFALRDPLGSGSNATVYIAQHLVRSESVAIKVVLGPRAEEPALRQALHRELRVVAGLAHPAVVGLVDHGVVDAGASTMDPKLRLGTPWIALELARGGTLLQWCGRLSWHQARGVLLQLLEGLAHAHARGVLHLDLKPSNVLVASQAPELTVQLADFGIAHAVGGGEATRVGTPEFMAPEQFDGGPLGPWTDLYALGCLAFLLLTGSAPFARGSFAELAAAHVEEDAPILPRLPGVPVQMSAWVGSLLERPAERRPATAAAAAEVLASLGKKARWPRRRPKLTGRLRTRDASLSLLPLRQPPLVGRGHQQGMLATTLAFAKGGTGSVVVLDGPPGVGVTRLGTWLGEHVEEEGLASAVDATHGVLPALRKVLGVDELAGRKLRSAVAEALGDASVFDGVAVSQLLERGSAHGAAASRVIVRALRWLTLVRPMVVRVVDSDEGVGLAAEVAASGLRVLVVVERRSLDESAPVEALLERTGVLAISLPLLDDDAIRELLDRWAPLEPGLRERVVRAAQGSPRRAVRLVELLADRDVLILERDGYGLATGADLPRLDSDAMVEARASEVLSELPAAERVSLAVAAVLGSHVDPAAWRAACEQADLPAPDSAVDRLMAARLVVPSGTEFAFVHPSVRRALHPHGAAAAELHRACASALAEQGADPARVAHHHLEAGELTEARPALVAAIRARVEDTRIDEAVALARRWRALVSEAASDQVEGWLVCAELARLRRDVEGLRTAIERLGACLQPHDRVVYRGRIAMAEADLASLDGDAERAERQLQVAADGFSNAGDALGEAMATFRLAAIARVRGDGVRARRLLQRARAQAVVADPDAPVRWSCELLLAQVQRAEGRFAEAEELARKVLEAARAAGRLNHVYGAMLALGNIAQERSDLGSARRWYADALRVADATGRRAPMARLELAVLCFEDGDLDEGRALVLSVLNEAQPSEVVVRAAAQVCRLVSLADAGEGAWRRARDDTERLLQQTGYRDPDVVRVLRLAAERARSAGLTARVTWLEERCARVEDQAGKANRA